MKWSTMRSRDRRAVVIGGLVLLPALLYIWGVRPYRAALEDARDQLATERATLARERAAIETARRNPRLQHVADSAMRAMRPRLFEGREATMASAELASYLGEVANQTRVYLLDAATRPPTPAVEGVQTLRVEIRAESDLRGALQFLQALEKGEKLVRVDRLDISRSQRGDEKDMQTLTIAATIAGFAVTEPSGPAPASSTQPAAATAPALRASLP